MSDVNADKLIEKLNEKWVDAHCPMCKSQNWIVTNKVYEVREYMDGNMVIGNVPIIPIIPITCGICGNTVFINAKVLDIVEE